MAYDPDTSTDEIPRNPPPKMVLTIHSDKMKIFPVQSPFPTLLFHGNPATVVLDPPLLTQLRQLSGTLLRLLLLS